MKRPEGFDKPPPEPAPARKSTARTRPAKPTAPTRSAKPVARTALAKPASPKFSAAPTADALAKRQLRQAGRSRRRAERAELRRFTRRARVRKMVVLSVAAILAFLLALIAVAVFSPILALRTVVIDGANRVDPGEVQAAVSSQLGTPLALLNFDAITESLSVFPLIRTYVTEIVPPDTLLIHIVEREPIGSITVGGVFRLVDPAGVTIQESAERIPGVPVIEAGSSDTSSAAFAAVTQVLLSLPATLSAQVDSVSATTTDDVSFVLVGVGQRVVWGSASDSTRKAALLASLISITDAGRAGIFDVSAPTNGVFRPS